MCVVAAVPGDRGDGGDDGFGETAAMIRVCADADLRDSTAKPAERRSDPPHVSGASSLTSTFSPTPPTYLLSLSLLLPFRLPVTFFLDT
jgi:hypothetical protein